MGAKLLGAHMGIKNGLGAAVRNGHAIGCTAIQVFTSSPQQWYSKPVTQESVDDFKKAQKETGIDHVVSHDSYLINLCSVSEDLAKKSFEGLKSEIVRCGQYGIPYVVSHIGRCKDQTEGQALLKSAEAIRDLLEETPETVTLLMETTAGQASAINHRFEHLAMLLELCQGHPRLGICLDTCHVFVAGYDIRTPETYAATFEAFDRTVGLDRLKVIHCNDSQKGLRSAVDRHEHIGKGELGLEPFRMLVNDPRFENTPILLETNEPETMHQVNLDTLKSLIEG